MLLVDDDKRQMLKRHVVRKDRVGSKEDVELARFQLRMDLLALGRRRGTRQECPRHASLGEQGASLIGILARQHARRRHNAGLGARIGRDSQRADFDQAAVVAQAQRQLKAETFLVGKTPPRDVALGHTRGKVNRAQRTGIAHQAALDA